MTQGKPQGDTTDMASNKQTVITRPTARSEELLIQHVDSETVAYDERTKTAHALRPLAAAVFMYADGTNTVEEIVELASYRLDQAVTPAEVSEAVDQLDACDLLDTPAGILSGGISRRTALKTLAAAGAGTVLVSSIAAPFASAASVLGNFGTGYTCAYVSGNGNYIVGSGGYDGDPAASVTSGGKATSTPKGWPIPYVAVSGSGGSTKYEMASGHTDGAPVSAGNYVLGASCYALYSSSSPVYGTYQTVPCDGPTWECANVVCVPTTTGKQSGTPSQIAGAVTSGAMYQGTGSFVAPGGTVTPAYGPYADYAYGPGSSGGYYPFKVCCGNGTTSQCTHNNS
jgi:hypothetical protein